MSGILGEGLLGDFLLGDSGESSTFAYGQAQALIITPKFAQAQADILTTYNGYGQGQSFIVYTTPQFAQAQASIQGRVYGQAQADILATDNRFAQAQADILTNYQGYAETQARIKTTYRGFGQASVWIITSYSGSGQAQARMIGYPTKFALAKGRIKRSDNYRSASARAFTVNRGLAYGQAVALIFNPPTGNAQALIDSPIKNASGQAQAALCFIDTFTRSETFGLGTNYTWVDFDSAFGAPEESSYGVDGSKVVDNDPPSGNWDSYQINSLVPVHGLAQFDFTTNSAFSGNYQSYFGVIFGDTGYDVGRLSVVVYSNFSSSQWRLTAQWSDIGIGSDVVIDIQPNTTYRVKAIYDSRTGVINAKVWNILDSEPNYQLYDRLVTPIETNRAWLSLDFAEDIVSLDNLQFCTGETPLNTVQSHGQAAAAITNTTPSGNANADILQIYNGYAQAAALLNTGFGLGNAQASILTIDSSKHAQAKAVILATLPFIDRFDNRVTVDPYDVLGMGDPYIWPGNNVFMSPSTPLFKNVYVDGEKLIINENGVISPPGSAALHGDGYWIPIKNLPHDGFIEFDFYTGSGTRGEYLPTVTISGTTTKGGMLDIGIRWNTFAAGGARWQVGNVSIGNSVSNVVLSDDTWYRLKILWTSAGTANWRIWNRDSGSEGSPATSGSYTWTSPSYGGRALSRIQMLGLESGNITYVDNIVIGKREPTGQARAKIKSFPKQSAQAQAQIGGFQYGQAQAQITAISQGYGQAQARISDGLTEFQAYAQATTYIGQYHDRGYAQARAFMNLRLGVAQAAAQITTTWRMGQAQAQMNFTWRMGQAQASINRLWQTAQAQATLFATFRVRGQARARIKVKRWVFAQAQAYIKPRVAYGQAKAQILRLETSKVGQAQAKIGSFQFGQAQAQIKVEDNTRGFGQAQALISFWIRSGNAQARIGQIYYPFAQAQGFIQGYKLRFGQALALIQGFKIRPAQARARIVISPQPTAQANARIRVFNTVGVGQAQAQIQGTFSIFANAQALIKRTIEHGQAQAWISQVEPGHLVRYNGYLLPGYLQEEALISETSISSILVAKYDFSTTTEYTGLKNKYINISMLVADSTYGAAKTQVNRAGTMLRSNREGYARLILINPDRYYMASTNSISMRQEAGINDRIARYDVTFEVKPWLYGSAHTLTGPVDTNNVGRTLANGTWTPAIVTLTGTNITVSGYSNYGPTGFVSVSGAVENLVIDSENYTATINGINRNDLMNNLDYAIYIAPGRTQFATTGVTEIIVEYEDRWPL